MLRSVPESALKTIMTRLAATASSISHPAPKTRAGTKTVPPPTPKRPARTPPKRPARPRITNSRGSTLSLNSGGARPAPAPEQVDNPHHERHRDRVVQVVEVVPDPLPVLAQNVPQVG